MTIGPRGIRGKKVERSDHLALMVTTGDIKVSISRRSGSPFGPLCTLACVFALRLARV